MEWLDKKMRNRTKQKEIKKIISIKSNEKIEEIINDYPQSLIAHPRGSFEEQLRKHLVKHKIK